MISYKEFLNKRNEIIREGFKDSDIDKVFILIRLQTRSSSIQRSVET